MAVDLSTNIFNPEIVKRDTYFNPNSFYKNISVGGYYTSGLQKIPSGMPIKIGNLSSYTNKYIRFYDCNSFLIKDDNKNIIGYALTGSFQTINVPKRTEYVEFIIQEPTESIYFKNIYLGVTNSVSFSDNSDVLLNTDRELSTYAELITLSNSNTITKLTTVKVLNDENKSQTETIYQLWPNGVRKWIAAVSDN